jgi:molecular chaperone GrpE (heat shock protein)
MSDDSEIAAELANIKAEIQEVRKDIQFAVAPKFLEISIQTNDLVELSIDYWRFEHKMKKTLEKMEESHKKSLENSLERIKRYLDKNDIEVIDHTDQEFDQGQNLEILAVEHDPKAKVDTIKETKEPTVLLKGQVVHIGKVIVVTKKEVDETDKNE